MEFPSEKLLTKFWETIFDKGMASFLKPWQIRRLSRANGDARRHELLMLAQASKDADEVLAGNKKYLPDGTLTLALNDLNAEHIQSSPKRIEPTLTLSLENISSKTQADAIKQEVNQTKAILFAEELLITSSEQEPSSKKVEDDWLSRWRESAGKTSNEDIQRLWGSILAGELISPGTFSLRTLDFLKGLSRTEAELIQYLAPFIWFDHALWRDLNTLAKHGLTYEHLLDLQELGILQGVDSSSLALDFKSLYDDRYLYFLRCHKSALVLTHTDPKASLTLPLIRLTNLGRQVIKLGNHSANINFLEQYAYAAASQGFKSEICDYLPTPKEDTEFEYAAFNRRQVT